MKTKNLHIGCSSYATPSWRPVFYPEMLPKKDWFKYYCRYFKTYEFNGSFYRFPTIDNLQTWYNKTPEDFKFSMKTPKLITHISNLQNCTDQIKDFYTTCDQGLKEKLACILWQFPPSFTFTPTRLAALIDQLDPNFKNIAEFRHISWWHTEVAAALGDKNITFCTPDYPGLPKIIQQNTSVGYLRMHGVPKLFYSGYSTEELKKILDIVNSLPFDEVFIYFNNTASTAGIVNAVELLNLTNQNLGLKL